jgi:hypothetical protein
MPRKRGRSLKDVVGQEAYTVWVTMLSVLVPEGRTHRLAPLVAGMLEYALTVAHDMGEAEWVESSVAKSLVDSAEAGDPSEVEELLHDVVARLFKDAGVGFKRTSAAGIKYTITESIYYEYYHWYDMPWDA